MKILTLLGSPKKHGNTAKILDIIDGIMTKANHEIKRINIAHKNVKGCLGCGWCENPNNYGKCVQEDDANDIFSEMVSSDSIIYASPLYCWDFTAQIKALIDRHFCLVTNYGTKKHKSIVENKEGSLIVTCAGPIEDNADLITTVFKRVCAFTKMRQQIISIFPNTASPIVINDRMNQQIRQISEKLLKK